MAFPNQGERDVEVFAFLDAFGEMRSMYGISTAAYGYKIALVGGDSDDVANFAAFDLLKNYHAVR